MEDKGDELLKYAPYTHPVPLIVVVHIGFTTIEVQVVRVRRIVGRRRPIVAVGPAIVETGIVVVAAVDAEERRSH